MLTQRGDFVHTQVINQVQSGHVFPVFVCVAYTWQNKNFGPDLISEFITQQSPDFPPVGFSHGNHIWVSVSML